MVLTADALPSVHAYVYVGRVRKVQAHTHIARHTAIGAAWHGLGRVLQASDAAPTGNAFLRHLYTSKKRSPFFRAKRAMVGSRV